MMSSALFEVVEHTVPFQHLRKFPRATETSEGQVLSLAVKRSEAFDGVDYDEEQQSSQLIRRYSEGEKSWNCRDTWALLGRPADC